MSEMPASDQFDRLQEKAVKYAIAVEARDAIQAQLKYWAAIAAVVGVAAGWFGFSLHGKIADLNNTLGDQVKLVEALEQKTGTLSVDLERREAQIAELTAQIADKQRDLTDRTSRLSDSATRIETMADKLDDESRRALDHLRNTVQTSAEHAHRVRQDLEEIGQRKTEAETAARRANASADGLTQIMRRAEKFDASIEGQRQVFRNALLDYVTMTRNAKSPELILSTPDPLVHFRVIFRTPADVRRTGFTLSYDVVRCQTSRGSDACDPIEMRSFDKVIQFERNKRDWHELEGTDRRYRFAVDYIFTSKLAKNYVTIRVGGTEKLLPEVAPAALAANSRP